MRFFWFLRLLFLSLRLMRCLLLRRLSLTRRGRGMLLRRTGPSMLLRSRLMSWRLGLTGLRLRLALLRSRSLFRARTRLIVSLVSGWFLRLRWLRRVVSLARLRVGSILRRWLWWTVGFRWARYVLLGTRLLVILGWGRNVFLLFACCLLIVGGRMRNILLAAGLLVIVLRRGLVGRACRSLGRGWQGGPLCLGIV